MNHEISLPSDILPPPAGFEGEHEEDVGGHLEPEPHLRCLGYKESVSLSTLPWTPPGQQDVVEDGEDDQEVHGEDGDQTVWRPPVRPRAREFPPEED